ncbi:MAG: VCBS repeat-containing protein, partial [Bryobacterales bacterium]|nr:VCBS repeat-containing protein [Bryobacterales bacterium]
MKHTSLHLTGCLLLLPALASAQEPARSNRIAVFDSSNRMVTLPAGGAEPGVYTPPGTHVRRVGEWGAAGKVRTKIVTGASRGKRGWAESTQYPANGEITSLATADFNNDSFDDAAIGTSRGVELRLGRGDGQLGGPSTVFVDGATALAPGDFNGDGHADLAAGSAAGLSILYGSGSGHFPTRADFAATAPIHILVTDVNADSIPDLILAPRAASEPIEVLTGDGQSFRTTRRLHPPAPIVRLAAADFNGDGALDIAAALAGEPRLLLWLDDNQPAPIALPAVAASIGVLDQGLSPHLTVRFAGRDGVFVMANDGHASFAEPLPAEGLTLDTPGEVHADLNNDNATDRFYRAAAQQVSVQPRLAGVTSITKSHTGEWRRGDFERMFVIQVNGSGNPTIIETLPAGLLLVSMAGGGWECLLPDEITDPISCIYQGAPVTNGPFPPLYVFVDVAPDAPNVMTNTVTDGNGVTATDTVVLGGATPAPDLAISKSHTGDFTAGQTHVYFLAVANVGSAASSGPVTVTEIPPTGMTVASLGGQGWTCDLPTLKCTRSDSLAPGASFPTITVGVVVAIGSSTLVQNQATVTGGGDTNPNNNSAGDLTTILKPDLSINKTHTGNFQRGQIGAQFTILVANVGTAPSTGATTVTDTLPAALTATAISGSGWTCSLSPLQCSRADALAPGASYPAITLTVAVSATAPTSVINQVQVANASDSNPNNDFGADIAAVDRIDLTIAKVHTGVFPAGSRASYTITVTNSAQLPTTGTVTVTDALPAALSNPSISGLGWTCQTSPTVSCLRSDVLAPGASFPAITLAADVSATPPASFTNTATVSGGGDSFAGNNTANDLTSTQGPDLTLSKTHTGSFYPGQVNAEWTITVTNTGNGYTAGEVRVNDTLLGGGGPSPIVYAFQSIGGPGWTCPSSPSAPYCTRTDALAPGASYPPIVVRVSIASILSVSSVSNSASVSGGGDTTPANNSDSDTVPIA